MDNATSTALYCAQQTAFHPAVLLPPPLLPAADDPAFPMVDARFTFHHAPPTPSGRTAFAAGARATSSQCGGGNSSCLLDLHALVLQEADVGFTRVAWFLGELLATGTLHTRTGRNFGWAPVASAVAQLRDASAPTSSSSSSSSYRVEAGGGSGMGYQLLCDARLVLYAGCGGGGGVEGPPHALNYGGGCGGGVQLDLSVLEVVPSSSSSSSSSSS